MTTMRNNSTSEKLMRKGLPIVVVGHVCLDVIPTFQRRANSLSELIAPGKLVDVGPAVLATGGAVANTGGALHRLGTPVRLVGKIGQDAFGDAVCALLRQEGQHLADHMVRDAKSPTSYSIVINPPGIDRVFLHCPGANDSFGSEDLPQPVLEDAGLFHFGYPPLMRRFYSDNGEELERLMIRARTAGLTTSLDMALPDPGSPAGQANWREILRRILPLVDLFVPSLDEIAYMLMDHEQSRRVREAAAAGKPLGGLKPEDIRILSHQLLDLGAAVVLLKLGRQGATLHVTRDKARLRSAGRCTLDDWSGSELHAACFKTTVVGTTGAGDCSIAGFLAAVMRGDGPREALRAAVATGAASVERSEATTGVPPWSVLAERLACGWEREPSISFPFSI